MNRSRLLMIGALALALGLLVSYSVYNRLKISAGAGNEALIDVVVASSDIPVGAKLAERDLTTARFPQASLPPSAYTKKAQVLGRGVVLPISKGEFFMAGKLAAENAGAGLPALIPSGMRAVSVRVNDVVAVAGFVQPGTRVDVLLTGSMGGAERQTTTVLENVPVIAVGKSLERNASGDAQVAPVITLLVSPDDGQKLALAGQEGRIQLALRNPLDSRKGDAGVTRESSLYPAGAAAPAQPKPKVRKVVASATPVAPTFYTVETIRGNKKEETKF